MAYILEITIPRLPILNTSKHTHWRKDVQEKKDWEAEIWLATRGHVPNCPLEKARVRYRRHSSAPCDYDNLVQSFKHPQDGLVKAGIMIDDRMAVTGVPDIDWEYAPPGKGFITMRVEEIS